MISLDGMFMLFCFCCVEFILVNSLAVFPRLFFVLVFFIMVIVHLYTEIQNHNTTQYEKIGNTTISYSKFHEIEGKLNTEEDRTSAEQHQRINSVLKSLKRFCIDHPRKKYQQDCERQSVYSGPHTHHHKGGKKYRRGVALNWQNHFIFRT